MATFTKKSNTQTGRYLQLTITQTQNIANNTSTLNWTLSSIGGEYLYYSVRETTVKINGQQVYYKGYTDWTTETFPAKKGSVSGSITVEHNSDGSLTVPVVFKTAVYSSEYFKDYGGNFVLDENPRKATLTSAPNFNDEQNPEITYSNPAGEVVESLKACIASADGTTIYVPYRDISKTGTSYTFNLTTAERNTLRNATKNSNTLAVKFYIETVIGGVVQEPRSSLQKTLTIKDPNPTLNPTAIDEGVNSLKLTGDANKIIKYFNYVKVNSGGAAVKGASIVSQKVVCGNKNISSGSGYFSNVESADFTFSITDSRGNTTTKKITKTLVNYVKLTCNLTASNPTLNANGTTATTQLKISGNYFNGTFGTVANSLIVQYRFKENNGSYGSWINATATKSGNTYTAVVNKEDLNYQNSYTFQARVQDEVQKTEDKYIASAEKKVKTIPVFDWGENDFKFNVPVYDEKGVKLGNEIIAENQAAVAVSGKILQETGFVSITPVANTPTSAAVKFKRTYKKVPTVVMSVASSVAGTQVLGYGQTGISTTGVNILVTRTNTVPTVLYYYVFGEVAD